MDIDAGNTVQGFDRRSNNHTPAAAVIAQQPLKKGDPCTSTLIDQITVLVSTVPAVQDSVPLMKY